MARVRDNRHDTPMAMAAVLALLLLTACGNGLPDPLSPIAVTSCAADVCGASGATTAKADRARLCPDSLDYGTTFTGGAGSGEYLKVRLDTANKRYQIAFIESEVPTSPGQVNETRAGLTIDGAYETVDLYRVDDAAGKPVAAFALPDAEQNRCAFVLKDGRTADGRYAVTIDPRNPPIFFLGNGILGGAIPGATVSFDGISLVPGITVATVPRKTFAYYPFIAFSKTVTDFSRVAGRYNELGIHFTPSGGSFQTSPEIPSGSPLGWQVDAIQASETLLPDGSCVLDATLGGTRPYTGCPTTGTNWRVRNGPDGSADNVFVSDPPPLATPPTAPDASAVYPAAGSGLMQLALAGNRAHGLMIVGDVEGEPVPIVIRVGYAHAGASLDESSLDDQIGISLLTPAVKIDPSSFSGAFISANSASACGKVAAHAPVAGAYEGACLDEATTFNPNVNYLSMAFSGGNAALIDPFAVRVATRFTLESAEQRPGLVRVTAQDDLLSGATPIFKRGDTGWLMKAGRLFAVLINGANAPNPFFAIGAFVQ